jgi:hypothetical protein
MPRHTNHARKCHLWSGQEKKWQRGGRRSWRKRGLYNSRDLLSGRVGMANGYARKMNHNQNMKCCLLLFFAYSLPKGPSTRVRLCVRIAIRFCAQFAYKRFRVLIIFWTPMTTAFQHISGKIGRKLTTLCRKSYTESYGNSYVESHV